LFVATEPEADTQQRTIDNGPRTTTNMMTDPIADMLTCIRNAVRI